MPVLLETPKLNTLLIFCVLASLAAAGDWGDGPVFTFSLIGMIPLAASLGFLTEQLALHTNPVLGGLLNATFGNATELIISVFALKNGMLRIIQVSLLGSILSNMLLVLGSAFWIGGLRHRQQKFNKHITTINCSLLLLSVMGILFPAMLNLSGADRSSSSELQLSRFTAILLLLTYVAYIYFQLKTHIDLFHNDEEDDEEAVLSMRQALGLLTIVTILISIYSEYLVAAIRGAAESWKCPEIFIGVILIPIVGNAAEHASALTAAAKNKVDLCLGVAIGSSTQIALFGVPFMVIVAWIVDQPLSMYFQPFETATVFASTLIVAKVTSDGTSNWLSGLMLVVAYILVAAAFFAHK
jgi:Ca2+:H+ antiporter